MPTAFLIFPNQLFEEILNSSFADDYYLIEDPRFFGYDFNSKLEYNFNKLKLMLHRSSMLYFYDKLREKFNNIHYIEFHHLLNKNSYQRLLKKYDMITFYDTVNKHLNDLIVRSAKNTTILESPNFLTNLADLASYHQLHKGFFHKTFYEWQKKRLGIRIKGSYDKLNRLKIPDSLSIPAIPHSNKTDEHYIKLATAYVDKWFPNNYGNTDLLFPISHTSSQKWLINFFEKRLSKFGDYQDAMKEGEPFLFHSAISPMLNIGLINPSDILRLAAKYKSKVSINEYEGFIRQIIGWREYQRFIYIFLGDTIAKKNFFKNKRPINSKWYSGNTGILPVDDAIRDAFKYGYLHHIRRLMVMCNFMNLCELLPSVVYKWFMEFSVDSYEWVMIGNVYSMGLYADGGMTMRKPYISADSYITGMSNYHKGNWNGIWKAMYYRFLMKHRKFFIKTYYKNSIKYFMGLPLKERKDILLTANNFIKSLNKI